MSVTPQQHPIAKIEQTNILDLISRGKRIDGRGLDDYRDLNLQVGPIEKANGSSQVYLGKTKVLAGVKIQSGTPFPDTPNEGILTVNAELVPLASPSFEPGPPGENAIELARVVDRGIRESKAIDLKRLCIDPGKKVFVVFLDLYILDHDGNLIDASATAALSALLNAKMQEFKVDDGELVLKEKLMPLPLLNRPVTVTFAKLDKTIVVDPCLEEEQVMTARLTIAVNEVDSICAMQKGGLGVFTPDEVRSAAKMAVEKAPMIRSKVFRASS